MSDLHWTSEEPPTWDEAKASAFGPTELASVGLPPPQPGQALADDWWHVEDDTGRIVGWGWLDNAWGDAHIRFLVHPRRRGEGIGEYIVSRLEEEAGAQGLNYITNVIPSTHPDREWMAGWLQQRGFTPAAHGELRRQVGDVTTAMQL